MILKIFLSVIFLINSLKIFSQDDGIFEKEITADDFKIILVNKEKNSFTGSIQIADKYNNTVFYAGNCYSGYISDTFIDLNNDGRKELILDLNTDVTAYDFSKYLIFDFSKDVIEPFEVQNAYLVTDVDGVPKIVSNARLSPAYLGAGYSYSLKYEKGKLILETDPNESKALKNLTPSDDDYIEIMSNFKSGSEECEDGSPYSVYFDGYITQMKILNNEKKGWEFFDKYYQCGNKDKMRAELQKTVDECYNTLKSSEFRFSNK